MKYFQNIDFFTLINPFQATGSFIYPLKMSENLWLSDVFRDIETESRRES